MGVGDSGEVYLSEEDRESHVHILGSPGEGKSKFLELLVRQDIDAGNGACLIDPSDNGDTAYKVLKYAIKKGYQKIVLIDPHDIWVSGTLGHTREYLYGVPTIQPIHHKAPAPAVIGNLMDSIRVLWDTKSFSETPRIQKYLPAVFTALHKAGMTLVESKYFMDRTAYARQFWQMINTLDDDSLQRNHIVSAFQNNTTYEQFQSTVNRLEPFTDPTLSLIFGSNETPMNFMDLVSQKFLILVVADPEGLYGQEHQRLLCTLIINEITYAISRLRNSGWRGIYYLYIDEAGDYATSKLSYILDKKRKSGLRLTLSHQRFNQFSDKDVSSAVYGGTKIKVLFNTASREDRDQMIRMMYGGELSDRDVSYTLSQLKKQNAVIKINKQPPVAFRVHDTPDVIISPEDLETWKIKHYHSFPWYRSVENVREEINKRFVIHSQAPESFRRRTPKQTNKPKPQAATGEQSAKSSPREDRTSSVPEQVFDDIAGSPIVLPGKKRRHAGQADDKDTQAGGSIPASGGIPERLPADKDNGEAGEGKAPKV